MTASLPVSGIGGIPAVHTGGGASCQVAIVRLANVNLVCTGDNGDSIPISPTVYNVANGNDISLIETKIENILVGNGSTVVLDAPNVTGNSVTTIGKIAVRGDNPPRWFCVWSYRSGDSWPR